MTRLKVVRCTAIALGACASAAPAFGQASVSASRPRVLVEAGALVMGSANAGQTRAVFTASDGTPVTQFTIDRSLTAAAGAVARLQIRAAGGLSIEVNGTYARPNLRSRVSGDAEADAATLESPAHQFSLGGGALFLLPSHGRWQPFARGAYGWLRQLSDDLTLYQDGWTADAGGGVMLRWKDRQGAFRPYGVRFDGGLNIRHGGLAFTDKPRLFSAFASAALVLRL